MADFEQVILRGVRKRFGRNVALAGVDAVFARGEPSLVMGPNGAGKSTLLSILATLSRPTSGEVLFDDMDHLTVEKHHRGAISLVAHDTMLYPQMSGRENLLFFARLHGVSGAAEQVARWLDQVGMAAAADRPVQELSRGMTQRITLARALMPDPGLLLLDEPFTGLDRDGVELLRREVDAAARRGAVVIIVSHDLDAVDGLCGNLLVLRRGKAADELRGEKLTAGQLEERYHAAC